MVVKPYQGLVRTGRAGRFSRGSSAGAGSTCGSSTARSTPEPANLARLRDRKLSRKRSLAWREHVLGLAALDRTAAGEPLRRVHEMVVRRTGLESEPVDPRL